MNQRPQGFLLAKAIEGFLQFKTAEALSPRTIESYKKHLEQWLDYAGDVKVSRLTTANVRAYLAYMFTEFVPRRIAGGTQPLKPKSIRNIWITLSSFFTWTSTEFNIPSPMKATDLTDIVDSAARDAAREIVGQAVGGNTLPTTATSTPSSSPTTSTNAPRIKPSKNGRVPEPIEDTAAPNA